MVFSIVVTGLWLVNYVAGQGLHPAFHISPTPWNSPLHFTAIAPRPIPVESKTQFHYEDGSGFGKYGHFEATSSHVASHDPNGNKAGEFTYLKSDGTRHITRYVADSNGYRVESNDLPVGPATVPAAHSLKKRSASYPYAAAGPAAGPAVSPDGYLADTPEVAAAKASHFQEHAKRGNYMTAPLSPTPTPYSTWSTPASTWSGPTPTWSGPTSTWSGPTPTWSGPTPTWSNSPSAWPTPAPSPSTYPSWSTTIGKQQGFAAPYSFGPAPYASWSNQVGGWPTQTYSSAPSAEHPIVTPDGYLKDTPEVAQAKAAHFAEKAKTVNYHEYPSYQMKAQADSYINNYYSTPAPAVPTQYNQFIAASRSGYAPITPEGQVTDTPEVSAAKASHYAEYQAAVARNTGSEGGYVAQGPQQYSFPTAYSHASGVPAETPEVAQAKAAHLSEYARVANRLKRSISYGTYPASTLPLSEPALPAEHSLIPSPLPISPPAPPQPLFEPALPALPLQPSPFSISPLPYSSPFAQSSIIHSPFASSYHWSA